MTPVLLDANVLIALAIRGHVHHRSAQHWLDARASSFATCPVTQGSLVRLVIRQGDTAAAAQTLLAGFALDNRHEFWFDDVSYANVDFSGVIGHRQVTDAYLAHLARVHNGRLATFDQGLAKLHDDVAELVPV